MKAYVYDGAGKARLCETEKPKLPAGGALTKILAASVCGTDLRLYRHGNDKIGSGRILGHEACHVIEAIDNDSGFQVGERVIVAPAIGCGECISCKKGRPNMCDGLKTLGFEYDGVFAAYCAIPAQAFRMGNVVKAPEGLSDAEVCMAEPVACAINGQDFLNISEGENVLIYGAGFIGCVHAELAKIKQADTVIIAELSKNRREQAARKIPGIIVLNPADENFLGDVRRVTNGAGVDVVITACPSGQTHRQALELVNKNGRISLFGGLPGAGEGFLSSNMIHYKEIGVFGVHASTPTHNSQALSYISSGALGVKKYAAEFALEDIDAAFGKLVNDEVIKAILKP